MSYIFNNVYKNNILNRLNLFWVFKFNDLNYS